MIITKTFTIGTREFTKTYSDDYRYIVRDGISYVEANDPSEFGRTYVEGDAIEITDSDYAEAARLILGADYEDVYANSDNEQEYIEIGKMFMGVEEE